jgi:hypothetical protein
VRAGCADDDGEWRVTQPGRGRGVLFLHGFPKAEIVPGFLKADFVEQPSVGCGAVLPGIAVPGQEGWVVLPGAPARFMDAGGAADGADSFGDIGIKGRLEETLLGGCGVEGHWWSCVVNRHLGVQGCGGTGQRLEMAAGNKSPRIANPPMTSPISLYRGRQGRTR